MRWDDVLRAVTTRMADDAVLQSIYGDAIRKMGTHKWIVPSLDYMMVSRTVNELWEPMTVQFSQWVKTMDDLSSSEKALSRLFDHENMVVIEGITMWAFFEEGGDLTGPENEGYYGAASRYRFIPIRERLLPGRSS